MRFQRRTTPPPFLNRRDQRRMLALVVLLGLVMICIRVTAQPSFWWWIAPETQEDTSEPPERKTIDHSVRFDEPLRPDEFRALFPEQSELDSSRNPAGEADPLADRSDDNRSQDDGAPTADSSELPSQQVAPLQIPPELAQALQRDRDTTALPLHLLDPLVDRQIRIRREEADAYFFMLRKIRDLDPDTISQAVIPGAGYTSLMTDPEQFHGKIVRLRGRAQRIEPVEAPHNPFGVDRYVNIWMYTDDSLNNPIHIQSNRIPADIPTGSQLGRRVELEVTGYFFRIEGYLTENGTHTAPLILAGDVKWIRPRSSVAADDHVVYWLAGLVALVAIAMLALIWSFKISDRRLPGTAVSRAMQTPDQLADLSHLDTVDPAEQFAHAASELDEQSPPHDSGG